MVEMSVPLYEEFKARVQHVDVYASRMYVSPLCASGYRNELLKAFSLLDATKEARERPASITSSKASGSFIAAVFLLFVLEDKSAMCGRISNTLYQHCVRSILKKNVSCVSYISVLEHR